MACLVGMRTEPPSLSERQFIIDSFKHGLRSDERGLGDFRQAVLVLGKQRGTAMCTIGTTKVMCAISASITEPTKTRPTKGIVSVEVDMSPMASPAHEADRLGAKGLELTRLLEMTLRDSRCIDVEALCIRARESVWKVRVDVRVLDDDGSLVDCSSCAAAAALAHYARPDVSVGQETTTIHAEYEKSLVPLSIYHMPICVTFGISQEAKATIVDPSDRESLFIDGTLVIACNKRREICVLHQNNHIVLTTHQITECVNRAMSRTEDLTELVMAVIRNEEKRKNAGEEASGFETAMTASLLTCRTAHPNELIAPAIRGGGEGGEKGVSPLVKEENALGDGSVPMDEDEARVQEQVDAIVDEVGTVDIAVKEKKETKRKKERRMKEAADVGSLLDDLEGDIVELEGTKGLEEGGEGEEEELDLTVTKKKKRKK